MKIQIEDVENALSKISNKEKSRSGKAKKYHSEEANRKYDFVRSKNEVDYNE